MVRPLFASIVVVVAVWAVGCPPERDLSKHDPMCDEMLKCMFDDEAILRGAGEDKYRGLIEGADEIRTAFGPGGTCWTGEGDEGERLKRRCRQECLCALGETCLDPDFRRSLCEHDVSAASCNDAERMSIDEESLSIEPGFGDYVSTSEFSCKGKPAGGTVCANGDDGPCGDNEVCSAEQGEGTCVKSFRFGAGRCCHFGYSETGEHTELAASLFAEKNSDFLRKCDGIDKGDQLADAGPQPFFDDAGVLVDAGPPGRYPRDEGEFCGGEGEGEGE